MSSGESKPKKCPERRTPRVCRFSQGLIPCKDPGIGPVFFLPESARSRYPRTGRDPSDRSRAEGSPAGVVSQETRPQEVVVLATNHGLCRPVPAYSQNKLLAFRPAVWLPSSELVLVLVLPPITVFLSLFLRLGRQHYYSVRLQTVACLEFAHDASIFIDRCRLASVRKLSCFCVYSTVAKMKCIVVVRHRHRC